MKSVNRDEFRARVCADHALRSRFVANPLEVMQEFAIDCELTDSELGAVVGGTSAESTFVHSVLSSVFKEEDDKSPG